MNKYIEKAIREVAHTDNPEAFAQTNQTAYQIANNVYEQLTKDAVEADVFWYDGLHITFDDDAVAEALPAGTKDGSKVKMIFIKEE